MATSAPKPPVDRNHRISPLQAASAVITMGSVAGILIVALGSHGRDAADDPAIINGTWVVTRIDVGTSEHIAVPGDYPASFEISEHDRTLEASFGASGYSCRFARDADELALLSCQAAGNIPVDPNDTDIVVSRAAERAFRTGRMSMSQDAADRLTIQMGDVRFSTVAQ